MPSPHLKKSGKTKTNNTQMTATFAPGFRLSRFDILILSTGIIGSAFAATQAWWAGAIIGFVVLHFFLFCNVFRIARKPELIWAAAFLLLAGSTILTGVPGWITAFPLSGALSIFLIWKETKNPGYHGIAWNHWNPNLPTWWEQKHSTNFRNENQKIRRTEHIMANIR